MKHISSFYSIGTTGFLLTAIMHIVFSLFLNIDGSTTFIAGYALFGVFLVIGTKQIISGKNHPSVNKKRDGEQTG